MGGFLVLLSLVGLVIAGIALVRGHLDWARIRSRRVGVYVLLGSLALFVLGGTLLPPTTPTAGPASTPTASPTPPPPLATATASPTGPVPGAPVDVQGPYPVVDVVDGDTYRIARPDGTVTLRLIGIDTPETRDPDRPVECYGKEATAAAQQLVGGKTVWVHGDPTQDAQDRYGRALVYVWLADGTLVNEQLIRDGVGIEYTYDKPYERQGAFRAAQQQARQAGRGLWAASTCNGNPDLPATPTPTSAPPPVTQAPVPQPTQAPAPPPAPAPPAAPRTTQAPPAPDPGSGGGAVYYPNCDAARAAGAAPIRRGQPGYRAGLDRDGDGIACDKP